MNVIFLDIDGVVTSTLETPGSYMNHIADEYGPSPKCVERILKLCDETNSKIVISSNWRKFGLNGKWTFDGNEVTNPLSKLYAMIDGYYIGTLPPIRHKTKSYALIEWLKENNNVNFVVFDDDNSEGFQFVADFGISSKFIHTDSIIGLTDADCEKAKDILKGKI